MSIPEGFRFTLGQSMAAIAIFAVLISAALSETRHEMVAIAIRFVGVGVCLYNLRISRGMWLVLVGYIGPWLVGIAAGQVFAVRRSTQALDPVFIANVFRVSKMTTTMLSLFFVLGLAMTLRDVRRRLFVHEVVT